MHIICINHWRIVWGMQRIKQTTILCLRMADMFCRSISCASGGTWTCRKPRRCKTLPPPPGRTGTAHDHPSADPCPALEGRLPGLVPAEEAALVLAAVGAKHKHDTNRNCAANMLFADNMQIVNTLCADKMQTNMQTTCRLIFHKCRLFADKMRTLCTHCLAHSPRRRVYWGSVRDPAHPSPPGLFLDPRYPSSYGLLGLERHLDRPHPSPRHRRPGARAVVASSL